MTVLVLQREDGVNVINPHGSEMLAKGDKLVLFGKYDDLERIGQRLGVKPVKKGLFGRNDAV